MNSVPNSDSEQCTESKLGWIHQMHTLAQPGRTGHAHYAQAGCVAAMSWAYARPYRGLWSAVLQTWPAMLQTWPAMSPLESPHTQHQGHARAPCRALAHVSQIPCAVSQSAERRIAAPSCIVSRHKVAPLPATIQLLYRDPAPSSAHCASYRTRAWPYRGPTTPCRGPCLGLIAGRLGGVVAESLPVHARPCTASLPSLSQYSLLYCDSN